MEQVLLKNTGNPGSARIEEYLKAGGYRSLPKALARQPKEIIDIVRQSGLRGRGGAGFPTGTKWSFVAADPKTPKYLVCNADEGEPGTFKDKPILEKNPHLLIEGMAIAGYALGAQSGYIYLRGEYPFARQVLEGAIAEAAERGFLGDNVAGAGVKFHLHLRQGAGAYICGEETALLESLEGRRGQPRSRPPFPANVGAWGMPTSVNNVETLANVPYIMEIGAEAYSKIGTQGSPGPKLFCVSGCVEKPGVYELPMGTTLREIIYTHAGGIRGGKKLKAVFPGGISTPVLPADRIDCPMDFVSMTKFESMLGSGAVIVLDESVSMVQVAWRALKFFEHESCGKCTPCREGTGWLRKILERQAAGQGRAEDIQTLQTVAAGMSGRCFCPLGDGAAATLSSILKHFGGEFS